MRTISYPVDNRPAYWTNPLTNSPGSFEPTGKMIVPGDYIPNIETWDSDEPMWTARLFVGFNVGKKPKFSIKDLVPIVKRIRLDQVDDAGASFLLQHGLYTYETKKGKKKTIPERGAQVIVLNLPKFKTSPEEFKKQMVFLAEMIAKKLKQDEVIVELQRDGIRQKTIGVTAN